MLQAHYATVEDIDSAMIVGCGYPLGPFDLLDVVGLDVALRHPAHALPGVPRARASRPRRCWSSSSRPATWAARPAAASATTAEPTRMSSDERRLGRPAGDRVGRDPRLPLPGLRPRDPAGDPARGRLAGRWTDDDAGLADRRHWHTACWRARGRRGPKTQRSRNAPRY